MGPKYSKGVRNTPVKLEHLKSFTILEVRMKAIMMSKLYGKKNLYFFENHELEEVFELTGDEVFLCTNLFAKNAGMTKISSLDFWCGLALASSGDNEDKLSFCAKIMDTNGDDLLSYHEVLVLFLCATRGIACLKGLEFVPEETLDKVVMDAFASNQKYLKENGEISIHILVSFLLSQELCRTYLIALGAKIPPVDTAALVTKRTYYMKELASLRCDMEEAIICMQEEEERRMLEHERGGDIEYIRSIVDSPRKSIHEIHVRRHSSIKPLASILGKDRKIDEEHLDRDKLPANHPANTLYKTDESWLYELYNPKPNAPLTYEPQLTTPHMAPLASSSLKALEKASAATHTPQFSFGGTTRSQLLRNHSSSFASASSMPSHVSIYSKAFEDSFRKEWKKLPNDEMLVAATLDPIVLMAMLEQVDVIIPLSIARRIMDEAQQSQLGRLQFDDILYRLRCLYNTQQPDSQMLHSDARLVYHWTTQFKRQCFDAYRSCKAFFKTLAWQRRVLQGVDRAGLNTNFAKKLADFRSMSFKRPFNIDSGFYINEEAIPKKPNAAEDRLQGVDAYDFPVKIQLSVNTIPFSNLSTKRPRDSSRLKSVNDVTRDILMVEEYKDFQANDLLDYFNLRFEEQFTKRQEEKAQQAAEAMAAKKLAEENGQTLEEIQSKSAAEKLEHAKEELAKAARRSSLGGTAKGLAGSAAGSSASNGNLDMEQKKRRKNGENEPREYEMVTWFCFDLLPGLEEAHAIVVREALRDFFETIPCNTRKELYHDVVCEIVTPIFDFDEKNSSSSTAGLGSTAPSGPASPAKSSSMANFFTMFNKAKKRASAADVEGGGVGLVSQRVVLVALFHEMDSFSKLEQVLLESDLYVSRSIQSFKFDFFLAQSMDSLFARSLDYHHFQDKLFGPLEEELGEHGINPLRFAKDLRIRKKQIHELLARVSDMPREECMMLLREDGWNDRGSPMEQRDRVKRMLQEKLQRMGHGELSGFGKRNIETIFYRMKNQLPPSPDATPNPSRPTTSASSPSKRGDTVVDEGLTLWEMNELLEKSDTKTFYSKKEYLSFMLEEELLMDREQQLTLRGLQRYYEKHGRLAEDILRWGTGGLDALIAGYVHVSMDFDAEGLYSLFHLMESRPLIVPHVLKVLGDLSSWKEVKCDGRLDRFSELLDFLPFDRLGIPALKDRLSQVLRQPGGLVEVMEFLFSKVMKSDTGWIPVLRRYLSPSGFEYQTYQTAFADSSYLDSLHQEISETLHVLVEEETRRVQEAQAEARKLVEEENQRILTAKVAQLKAKYYAEGNILITEDMIREEAQNAIDMGKRTKDVMIESMMQEKLKSSANTNNLKGGKGSLPAEQQQQQEQMQFLRRHHAIKEQLMTKKARSLLPRVLLPSPNIDLTGIRQQIIDDLIFLHEIRTIEGMSFTLEESMAIDERRIFLTNKLESIESQLQEQEKSLIEHSVMIYDILRQFTTGISSCGWGTKDICLRGFTKGMNIFPTMCMPGCGELSFMHERAQAKKERFEQRKQFALAAIERERLRRTMTAEDHARIQRMKERKIKARFAKEEKKHFWECHRAFRNLSVESRIHKHKIPMIDWANILKRYEQLMRAQDEKYPQALPAQIMKNNIALLYYEVYGVDHPLSEPAQFLLQEAAERMITLEEDHEDLEDDQQEQYEKQKAEEAAKDPNHALDMNLLTAESNQGAAAQKLTSAERQHRRQIRLLMKILIIVQYFQMCTEMDNATAVSQAASMKMAVYEAFHELSPPFQLLISQFYSVSPGGIFGSEQDILLDDPIPLMAPFQEEEKKLEVHSLSHHSQASIASSSHQSLSSMSVLQTAQYLSALFQIDLPASPTVTNLHSESDVLFFNNTSTPHTPNKTTSRANTATSITASIINNNNSVSSSKPTIPVPSKVLFCGVKVHNTMSSVESVQRHLQEIIHHAEQDALDKHSHSPGKQKKNPNKNNRHNHSPPKMDPKISLEGLLQRLELLPWRLYWQEIPLYSMRQLPLSTWLHNILTEVQHWVNAENSRLSAAISASTDPGSEDISSKLYNMDDNEDNGGNDDNDDDDNISGMTSLSSSVSNSLRSSKRLSKKYSSKSGKTFISESMSMRREKRQKFEAQRKLDALKRQEIAQQRNFLYRLIQTDQISDIFDRKAGHVQEATSPQWGKSSRSGRWQAAAGATDAVSVRTGSSRTGEDEEDEAEDETLDTEQRKERQRQRELDSLTEQLDALAMYRASVDSFEHHSSVNEESNEESPHSQNQSKNFRDNSSQPSRHGQLDHERQPREEQSQVRLSSQRTLRFAEASKIHHLDGNDEAPEHHDEQEKHLPVATAVSVTNTSDYANNG